MFGGQSSIWGRFLSLPSIPPIAPQSSSRIGTILQWEEVKVNQRRSAPMKTESPYSQWQILFPNVDRYRVIQIKYQEPSVVAYYLEGNFNWGP
jgi:hypothetical protein